jgi:hypothetical protein
VVISHPSCAWMGHPDFVPVLNFRGRPVDSAEAPLKMTGIFGGGWSPTYMSVPADLSNPWL